MHASITRILLVVDNMGDARAVRDALAGAPDLRFDLAHCSTLSQALDLLADANFDLVLSDLGLPDSQRLDTVRSIRNAAPEIPLVVLSALDDEGLAVEALTEGAQDYLVKAQIDGALLRHTLRYAVKRQHVQLQLLNLALIDELTGLHNRRGFLALAEHHARQAYRASVPFLLAFADLDDMKAINDTFGHQEGNRALVETAGVLKDSFRQSDILARLGGDEFAVLIAHATEDSIEAVLERIQRNLDASNALPERRYELSLSVGIVAADLKFPNVERMLEQADSLMYRHKQHKRAVRGASAQGR